MSENSPDTTLLLSKIDGLNNIIDIKFKSLEEKVDMLNGYSREKIDDLEERIKDIEEIQKKNNEKIVEIENAPAKKSMGIMEKIVIFALTAVLSVAINIAADSLKPKASTPTVQTVSSATIPPKAWEEYWNNKINAKK